MVLKCQKILSCQVLSLSLSELKLFSSVFLQFLKLDNLSRSLKIIFISLVLILCLKKLNQLIYVAV